MKRILLVLATALIVAAMVVATAGPAFSKATVEDGACQVSGQITGGVFERCHQTNASSGNVNGHFHHNAKKPKPQE